MEKEMMGKAMQGIWKSWDEVPANVQDVVYGFAKHEDMYPEQNTPESWWAFFSGQDDLHYYLNLICFGYSDLGDLDALDEATMFNLLWLVISKAEAFVKRMNNLVDTFMEERFFLKMGTDGNDEVHPDEVLLHTGGLEIETSDIDTSDPDIDYVTVVIKELSQILKRIHGMGKFAMLSDNTDWRRGILKALLKYLIHNNQGLKINY